MESKKFNLEYSRKIAGNIYTQNSQEFGHLHRKDDIKFK